MEHRSKTIHRLPFDAFEGNVCIAFLEALILESKKEINRHAVVCANYSDEWNPPEWATKYIDVGI